MSGSEDWQPGDLALYVRNSHKDNPMAVSSGWQPSLGGIYTVAAVWNVAGDPPGIGLDLAEDTCPVAGAAWDSRDFRKIRPHSPDAEDAETIRLLNSMAVPA